MRELLETAKQIFGDIVVDIEKVDNHVSSEPCISLFYEDKNEPSTVILTFSNGAKVSFRTSEWAWIEKVD